MSGICLSPSLHQLPSVQASFPDKLPLATTNLQPTTLVVNAPGLGLPRTAWPWAHSQREKENSSGPGIGLWAWLHAREVLRSTQQQKQRGEGGPQRIITVSPLGEEGMHIDLAKQCIGAPQVLTVMHSLREPLCADSAPGAGDVALNKTKSLELVFQRWRRENTDVSNTFVFK
jgi:hypothetical protein